MTYFFDVIIFGFLLLDGWLIFRLFSKGFVLVTTTAMAAWIVIFYGSFIEPQRIVVVQQAVTLRQNDNHQIQAVVISDIHAGRYKGERYVQRMVDKINEVHPDVVFLLGDFVIGDQAEAAALQPFQQITNLYPTYAIMGNHDYDLGHAHDPVNQEQGDDIARQLESDGIHVLRNDGLLLRDGLWLAGVEEIWTKSEDIDAAIAQRPAGIATILLTHNPDLIRKTRSEQSIDLMLAGHTHGGQIRLPVIGPVPHLPDELGRDYDRGLFNIDGIPLFITSGIGESGPRARLFNPPEIVSLTIGY